jgi:hypothetical protein
MMDTLYSSNERRRVFLLKQYPQMALDYILYSEAMGKDMAAALGPPVPPDTPRIINLDAATAGFETTNRRLDSAERQRANQMGDKNGCSGCGATTPGTKPQPGRPQGNWIGDHQLPKSIDSKGPWRIVPHCQTCSDRQGLFLRGLFRWFRAGGRGGLGGGE